jgi:hypothetical protein
MLKQKYILIEAEDIVHMNWLTANLPEDSSIEEAIKRNSLEKGFPDYYSQYI